MKYAVLWSPAAKQWLIAASTRPGQFPLTMDTARRIDRQLSLVPQDVGESREDGARVLLVPPLGVDYEIIEEESLVVILRVWEYKNRT